MGRLAVLLGRLELSGTILNYLELFDVFISSLCIDNTVLRQDSSVTGRPCYSDKLMTN